MKALFESLLRARRPLLIFGWGVRSAHADALRAAQITGIPVATTWGARDLFPDCIGGFGTHGIRAANFAVQNADWILTVGTRLDTKATGSPASGFAPGAQVWMVDIDAAELGKMARMGRPVECVHLDASVFLARFIAMANAMAAHDLNASTWRRPDWEDWRARIAGWQRRYPPGMDVPAGAINPYTFVQALGDYLTPADVIVSDTGCALGWMMQAYPFKGERFIHAFNNTPMGYGLPAAVGAAFACPDRRIILVTGDGGLGVNITEFATVARHDLHIKAILFNNRGHAMCRQTQRTWLGGTYPSTSYEGGLATPNYCAVARAYGLMAWSVDTMADAIGEDGALAKLFQDKRPAFLNLDIPPECQIVPQVRAGRNLEDADPLLPREELAEIMRNV